MCSRVACDETNSDILDATMLSWVVRKCTNKCVFLGCRQRIATSWERFMAKKCLAFPHLPMLEAQALVAKSCKQLLTEVIRRHQSSWRNVVLDWIKKPLKIAGPLQPAVHFLPVVYSASNFEPAGLTTVYSEVQHRGDSTEKIETTWTKKIWKVCAKSKQRVPHWHAACKKYANHPWTCSNHWWPQFQCLAMRFIQRYPQKQRCGKVRAGASGGESSVIFAFGAWDFANQEALLLSGNCHCRFSMGTSSGDSSVDNIAVVNVVEHLAKMQGRHTILCCKPIFLKLHTAIDSPLRMPGKTRTAFLKAVGLRQ